MIETVEVTSATCVCGHVDYAPAGDEALATLPGFLVEVTYRDVVERGYACKVAHVGRIAKASAEKLATEMEREDAAAETAPLYDRPGE